MTEELNIGGLIKQSINRHRRAINGMCSLVDELETMAAMLCQAIKEDRWIYTCGNGGSAADAQHIAAELVGRFKKKRPATTDTSVLTSITNDFGPTSMFSRQVEAFVRANDVLWALSTSGKSHNVLEAMRYAKAVGADSIGFTGPNPPEEFTELCTLVFKAPGEDTAAIQECHQVAYHAIIGAVEELL